MSLKFWCMCQQTLLLIELKLKLITHNGAEMSFNVRYSLSPENTRKKNLTAVHIVTVVRMWLFSNLFIRKEIEISSKQE